jgi:tetratricopeptide (TPR) repeat protein
MLRHLAFFEELAKARESDTVWRATSAGLVVLRLVDRWIVDGPVEQNDWNVASVREAIAEIDDATPQRRILGSIVDAVAGSKTVNVRAVTPRLTAYAQTLEYDARWTLAIDVYRSVIGHAHPADDADLVALAFIQLGICLRNVGDLAAALEACERAQDVANAAGDMIGVLRARIVEAKIAISRGNLPRAEQILDDTIGRAEGGSLPDVRWRALHERATVAGMRGEFDRAIQFAYAALPFASSQRDRDRILSDVATGFLSLGLLDIARDAYLVLIATAQDQYVRWTSSLNLMEIAARQGAETVFDHYRRELGAVELPPYLRGKYLIIVGNGYRELGAPETGLPYLHDAVSYTSVNGLNHLLFEAEESLAASRTPANRAPLLAEPEVPVQVAGVAEAIRSMRETAGVGD